LDEEGHYSNDLTFIIPKADKYLLSLLNSKVLWYYFERKCQRVMGDTLMMYGASVERVPIYTPPQTTPAPDKARLLAEGERLVGDEAAVLGWAGQRIAAAQQDVIAELLGQLAGRMLDLNKARQAEIRRYLASLTAQTGVDLDNLSGKTTIQEYAGNYQRGKPTAAWAAIDKVLAKDRVARLRLTTISSKLQAEHAASLAALAPITAALQATDRLIDQLVYQLYGLTAAEIAVVEGTNEREPAAE